MTDVGEVITRVHREEWARVVATLARRLGDLDIAEEMAVIGSWFANVALDDIGQDVQFLPFTTEAFGSRTCD